MRRIVVVGTCGSGKTTLACQIGELLSLPVIELDALHWEADWTPAPLPVLRERVERAQSYGAWVVDGNYSYLYDLTWEHADTIVWLDYSLWMIMTRLLWRTFSRILSRKELWNGNREKLSNTLFSKDSILLWALQTYRKNRRMYSELMQHPQYAHLTFVHLRSPRAASLWLEGVQKRAYEDS